MTTTIDRKREATDELIRQLRTLGFGRELGFRDDANMRVRVHQKRGGYIVNTDVKLDYDRDLYDITVYRIDGRMSVGGAFNEAYMDVVAERTYEGVFADQLAELIGVTR
jgi:hypothetical protein